MVSDFFYPKVGGVESHIYMLSQVLIRRGHRVVVITHRYAPDRIGVRYLTSGLKVYHVPIHTIPPHSSHASLPQFFALLPLLRSILIRESIDIIHGHGSLSSMACEAIIGGGTMGVRGILTDHSLYGLGGKGEMWGNKMLMAVLSDAGAVISVSHTGKENIVLRANLDPRLVYVIPNALVSSSFLPDPSQAPDYTRRVRIICISRLVYRKGIDLLIEALPEICAMHPDVEFLIGGDGPKIIELEQMREKHQALLGDRVKLLGSIKHEEVRELLVQGHIFLNPSLTEAFGIGILEAACCGLFVVSTRVGGVPEILPDGLIAFSEPDSEDLVRALDVGIKHVRSGKHDPLAVHQQVRQMYSWTDVAERTEHVYEEVLSEEPPTTFERLQKYYSCGIYFGKILCIVVAVQIIFVWILELLYPRDSVDLAPHIVLDADSEETTACGESDEVRGKHASRD